MAEVAPAWLLFAFFFPLCCCVAVCRESCFVLCCAVGGGLWQVDSFMPRGPIHALPNRLAGPEHRANLRLPIRTTPVSDAPLLARRPAARHGPSQWHQWVVRQQLIAWAKGDQL